MVTNYNPCNPNIKNIIHKNWNIITNSADCGQLFTNRPIVGFRRLPNLRDMLTNAPVDKTLATPIPNICTRLGKCTYCPMLKKLAIVKCNFTHKSFKPQDLPKHITCEINNVIYLITWPKATNSMLAKHAEHLGKGCMNIKHQS